MASLGIPADTDEKNTSAGSGYLNLGLGVVLQVQKSGDLYNPDFFRGPFLDYPNKRLIPLILFHAELLRRCIPGLSSIALSTAQAKDFFVNNRIP